MVACFLDFFEKISGHVAVFFSVHRSLLTGFFSASLLLLSLLCILNACSKNHAQSQVLRVGVIAGPEAALVEEAQSVLKDQGIELTIIEFEDYALPNRALAEGDIDLNVFQHEPYLKQSMESQHYPLMVIGKTFIFPMGLYSQQYASLQSLPTAAHIGIPNDPSNQARALLLLANHHLLELNTSLLDRLSSLSLQDFENNPLSNPRRIRFISLDAALLPSALPDLDAALINTNFALAAGLNPQEALFLESKESPYANLIVASSDKDPLPPSYLAFVQAMHSPPVLEKAHLLFGAYAIPAW